MSDPRLHYREPLRETPFHGRVAAANRHHRWAGWAGCLAALDLGDPEMEHAAIRNAATLYDLSPMVKYAVEGPDAAPYLDRLTLRDAGGMATDAVRYTAWCDDAGQVLDDGTLFRLGERRVPALLPGAAPALAARRGIGLRRHGAGGHRRDRGALAAGPVLGRRARGGGRGGGGAQALSDPAGGARRGRAPRLAHGLHRRSGLRAVVRARRRAGPVGPADGGGRALGDPPGRVGRARPGADRGGVPRRGHRLRAGGAGAPARPRALALRAGLGLDDRLGQGPLQRPPGAPGRARGGLDLGAGGARRGRQRRRGGRLGLPPEDARGRPRHLRRLVALGQGQHRHRAGPAALRRPARTCGWRSTPRASCATSS